MKPRVWKDEIGRRGAILAVFVWVLFIWGHSLVAGPASTAESGRVVSAASPLFDALGLAPHVRTFLVRKSGHFLEYLVLGLLSSHAWGKLRWSVAAFLVAVPAIDETIQLFVPGRSCELRDVCLDCAGIAAGLLLAGAWKRIRQKKMTGRS